MARSDTGVFQDTGTLPVRLDTIRYGAEEIIFYEFEAITPAALPPVSAGAHVDIGLPGGVLRQYSLITPLCSPRRYVIAVKREENGRGGSRWLHDSARVGQIFDLSPPRNQFEITPGTSPVLLLAGGSVSPQSTLCMSMSAQAVGRYGCITGAAQKNTDCFWKRCAVAAMLRSITPLLRRIAPGNLPLWSGA